MATPPGQPARPTDTQSELERLRAQVAALRETLDSIDGTLIVYGPDREFVMANQRYHDFFPHLPADEDLLGLRFEDLLARSIDAGTVTDPEAYTDRQAFLARRIVGLNQRLDAPREEFHPHENRWHLLRVKHTPSGNRVALRVDITEQKRLQEELRLAREAAEQASQAKSQFLAGMNHEFRTPLNAVINFARLLQEQIHGPLGEQYADYAAIIGENGRHLLALVDRVLAFVRAGTSEVVLDEHPVNLRGLLHAVADRVTFIANISPTMPSIRGDSPRLRQVLRYFAMGAIGRASEGSRVEMEAVVLPDGAIRLSIAGDGADIGDEDIDALFQTGGHPDRMTLKQARHIIALHDGALETVYDPDRGSAVVVTLPATRVIT